jgi:hypothetical protein
MSRSWKKNPIHAVTTSESEAQDKAQWHRRHRRIESARLRVGPTDYEPTSHRAQSDPWKMDKDGKTYWGRDIPARLMRK